MSEQIMSRPGNYIKALDNGALIEGIQDHAEMLGSLFLPAIDVEMTEKLTSLILRHVIELKHRKSFQSIANRRD